MSTNPDLINFEDIDVDLGFEPKSEKPLTGAGIADEAIKHLKDIVNSGSPAGVDTKIPAVKADASDTPDYLAPFKEVFDKKLELPGEDTTDYSKASIEKFGASYAHLNTKDSFLEEVYNRYYTDEYISDNPRYAQLETASASAKADKTGLVKGLVERGMKKNYTYTEEAYATQLSRFIDEEGRLTSEGERTAQSVLNQYDQEMQNIEMDARNYAAKNMKDLADYKSAVDRELESFNQFGITLDDDMKAHLRHFINSGKGKEIRREAESKKDIDKLARIEILSAIVTSDVALANFIKSLDERGRKYGFNQKAKQIFN